MKKIEKINKLLNEQFRDDLISAMLKKFNIVVENEFNFFSMRLITTRSDGEPLTPEQHSWLEAYSEGYSAAMGVVASQK